jgi:hypothetical protein
MHPSPAGMFDAPGTMTPESHADIQCVLEGAEGPPRPFVRKAFTCITCHQDVYGTVVGLMGYLTVQGTTSPVNTSP